MTRTEKQNLKTKINRYRNISLISFASFIVTMVVTKIYFAPINSDIVGIVILLSAILIPICSGLFCWMMTMVHSGTIDRISRKINRERQDLHFQMFWDLLKNKKYVEAKDFYNEISLGQHKVFCEGLIMGMVHVDGADIGWKHTVIERMNAKLK